MLIAEYGLGWDWWWGGIENCLGNVILREAGVGFTDRWYREFGGNPEADVMTVGTDLTIADAASQPLSYAVRCRSQLCSPMKRALTHWLACVVFRTCWRCTTESRLASPSHPATSMLPTPHAPACSRCFSLPISCTAASLPRRAAMVPPTTPPPVAASPHVPTVRSQAQRAARPYACRATRHVGHAPAPGPGTAARAPRPASTRSSMRAAACPVNTTSGARAAHALPATLVARRAPEVPRRIARPAMPTPC